MSNWTRWESRIGEHSGSWWSSSWTDWSDRQSSAWGISAAVGGDSGPSDNMSCGYSSSRDADGSRHGVHLLSGGRRGGRGRGRQCRLAAMEDGRCDQPGFGTYSPERWWSCITESCPISLVPVAELEAPPFAHDAQTSGDENSVQHFFDGTFLAHWLVSSGDLSDPVNRRSLTRMECFALDNHVRTHHPEFCAVSVTDAFDLQAKCDREHRALAVEQVADSELQSLQREANAVLQSLFEWRRGGSHNTGPRPAVNRAGRRVAFHQGDLRVIDDDDFVETSGQRSALPDPPPVTFPPLSEEQVVVRAPQQWPAPPSVSDLQPPLLADSERGPSSLPATQGRSRPKFQLKKRSVEKPGAANDSVRDCSIFGAARPREEVLHDNGAEDPLQALSLSRSGITELCGYSHSALVRVANDQQLRTRWIVDIEKLVKSLLQDVSRRTLDLESISAENLRLVRELCDHCLLDIDAADDLLETLRRVRVVKTSMSRSPACWLSQAGTRFHHCVSQSLHQRAPVTPMRVSSVLLRYEGPSSRPVPSLTSNELQELLQCKEAEYDGPRWLSGGRCALIHFARRPAAQKCVARAQGKTWVVMWWSGDADWAEHQLQQQRSQPTQSKRVQRVDDTFTASKALLESMCADSKIATPRHKSKQTPIGGKWGALMEGESDESSEVSDGHEQGGDST